MALEELLSGDSVGVSVEFQQGVATVDPKLALNERLGFLCPSQLSFFSIDKGKSFPSNGRAD